MKYLKQLFIILSVSFLAELIKKMIPLPITASIYGIVLMFLCLQFKIIKVSEVKETSMFLIEIMPIMFIPAAVGIIETWGLISSKLLAYIVVTVVALCTVMVTSGWVTQLIIRKNTKKEERNE